MSDRTEIVRAALFILGAIAVIGLAGWRLVIAVEGLGKRGTWTAEDTWDPLPDADVTALAEAVGVLPDPASRTPVYESHRQPPTCGETWDDEVGCSLSSGHRCVKLGAHSTHRCYLCGSLVIEAVPTLREQRITIPTPDYTDTTLVPYGFATVHRGCLAARKAAATDHVCDGCGAAFVPSTASWTP